MNLLATNSPFTEEQASLINKLVPSLDPLQAAWLNGYLAGVNARAAVETRQNADLHNPQILAAPPAAASPAAGIPPDAPAAPVGDAAVPAATILYASQTGNCTWLAQETARRLEASGITPALLPMADTKPRKLKGIENLLIIVSTQGDGVPPDNGMLFYEDLLSKKAPRFDGTSYAVLGLGDVSYDDFCKISKDFDRRLAELGAKSLCERADCDLDFRDQAEAWIDGVIDRLNAGRPSAGDAAERAAGGTPANGSMGAAPIVVTTPPVAAARDEVYSRFNPFFAEVLDSVALNGRGSDKETQHLEITLEGSGLAFEPGDSIGIYPRNHGDLVDELIAEMGWSPDEHVPAGRGVELPLREALTGYYEITVLTKPIIEASAKVSTDGLRDLMTSGRSAGVDDWLKSYLPGRDLLDLIRDYGLRGLPAREVLSWLRKIPARLYSVASSLTANPGEVHLVIVGVRYEHAGRARKGVFSVHAVEHIEPGDVLPLYVNVNPDFRLPRDPATPVVMIGPGTGVAPFRGFLQERAESGARGRNWLFYGDRRFKSDFLYQVDWQEWLKEGLLTRMDVAFSRDARRKVYVQDRMRESGHELFRWLEEGAHLYVCGDEKHMAGDVHAALEEIVAREGGMSADAAKDYVSRLREEHRYQRDVY